MSDNQDRRNTGILCSHCSGMIVERSHLPRIGHLMVKATEKGRQIDGYHCEKCKTVFFELPSG